MKAVLVAHKLLVRSAGRLPSLQVVQVRVTYPWEDPPALCVLVASAVCCQLVLGSVQHRPVCPPYGTTIVLP